MNFLKRISVKTTIELGVELNLLKDNRPRTLFVDE